MICRCLQALAELLKINASVTNIYLGWNYIGAEGAKACCGVDSAEYSLNAAACHDFMSSASCDDSDKFGWFGKVLKFRRLFVFESCPTSTVAAVQELL